MHFSVLGLINVLVLGVNWHIFKTHLAKVHLNPLLPILVLGRDKMSLLRCILGFSDVYMVVDHLVFDSCLRLLDCWLQSKICS